MVLDSPAVLCRCRKDLSGTGGGGGERGGGRGRGEGHGGIGGIIGEDFNIESHAKSSK